METDVQQAIEAEKPFNNRNLLLVTFTEEEVETNTFKQLHQSVQEVHLLQAEFAPKCRYIIEVKDIFDICAVKNVIMEHHFTNRQVHVKLLEKFNDSYSNLDPYILQVNNLPSTISPRELQQLYPLSTHYTFLLLESTAVLVYFSKVQDSITAYKTTNFMQYHSNILTVKFYRKDYNNINNRLQKKRSFTEDRDTDISVTSDEEHIITTNSIQTNTTNDYSLSVSFKDNSNSEDDETKWKEIQTNALRGEDNKINDYSFKDNSCSYDDITKWKEIQTNALKDKKISDTLLVHNLPFDITRNELKLLFPNLYEYKFIPAHSTKSCIVRFKKVEDAVNTYNESDNIFKSNILQIEFYNDENHLLKKHISKQDIYNDSCIMTDNNSAVNEEMTEREDHQNKSRNEERNEERIDSFVLHVENLPLSTNNEDILQLFPDHLRHEIISVKNKNSTAAHVCFKTVEDTLKAYNACKNMSYKKKVLSVKFKSKKFKKLNPFAIMKRNTICSNDINKKQNFNVPKIIKNEIIIIDDTSNLETLEDDIEYNSEEENLNGKHFCASNTKNGNGFLDDLSSDIDFDADNIFALDDDYF